MKYHGGGMNMKKYKTTYAMAFSSEGKQRVVEKAQSDKSPRLNVNQNEENDVQKDVNLIDQNKKNNFRIHSKEASYALWLKQQQIRYETDRRIMIHSPVSDTKAFFQNTGPMQLNVRRLKEKKISIDQNSIASQPLVKQNLEIKPSIMAQTQTEQIKIDPKIKRNLSQQSKQNFLQFLLVQKAGKANDKKMLNFLMREYNYELPLINEKSEKKSLSQGTIPKNQIMYLHAKEESEQQIDKQVQSILHPNVKQNNQHSKKHDFAEDIGDNLPLDQFIKTVHESKTKTLKKLQQRQQLAQIKSLQFDMEKRGDDIVQFQI